jgi:acetyl-CoA carboxylase biotin carboxyl carrier protein
MDLEAIKQILDIVREHELSEFEVEQDGLRLKIRREGGVSHPSGLPHQQAPASAAAAADGSQPPSTPGAGTALDAADTEVELAVMKSPIVGTFYRSAEPGAPAFVDVGTTVKKGQVLCIIEAMKLMNEIESEYDGEVVSIYVENGHAVQYGERLFAIRPR